MNKLYLVLLTGLLAGCALSGGDPPETLASLCSEYDAAVAKLTPPQRAGLDQTADAKVDANCNGSGSFGPKPRGSQMGQVRDATAKVQKLAQS
jgi:hypothetical protein